MIISQCPRCHEGFRIPFGPIPEDAYAHCPWCRETFPISEVLGSLPPPLEIVTADGKPLALGAPSTGLQLVESSHHDPGVVSGNAGFEGFGGIDQDDIHETVTNETVAETIVDEDWHRKAHLVGDDHDISDEADDDPFSTWDGSKTSPIESMNVTTKSGSRKRKGAGIGTFLGIVLGGLASVPIAGGLLALMGRTPDWGFWPFQGEQAAGNVRAAPPRPDSDASFSPTSRSTGTPLRFDRDQTDSEEFVDPAVSAAQQIVNADLNEPLGDPASTRAMQVAETAEAVETELVGETPIDTAKADYSSVVDSDDPNQPRRVEIDEQQVKPIAETGAESSPVVDQVDVGDDAGSAVASSDSPPTSSVTASDADANSDASDLVSKASQMLAAMSNYDGDQRERRRRIGLTYQRIASVAGLMEEPSESLKRLAVEITESPIRKEIGLAGWEWLGYQGRGSDGIALIGRASVTDDGDFLIGESGERISLISDVEIPDGETVLVLGRLKDQGSILRVVHTEPIP